MPLRKVCLIGATGLVGSHLLAQLLADPEVERVISLGRRKLGRDDPRLVEHVVDFASTELEPLLDGETLFSALGTTLRKAGSKEAQREVDVVAPLRVARAAAKRGVTAYGLVSAVGASARSSIFYNRIKGELEDEVQKLGFRRVRIARPSILLGERPESRPMESLGASASKLLGWVPGLRRYRPIQAAQVARSLIRAVASGDDGVRILEPEDLFGEGTG